MLLINMRQLICMHYVPYFMYIPVNWKRQAKLHIIKKQNISEASYTALYISVFFQWEMLQS